MKKTIKLSFLLLCFTMSFVSLKAQADFESFFTYNTGSSGFLDNEINDIIKDLNGNIWLATGRGVIKYNGTSWENYYSPTYFRCNLIYEIEMDNTGNLYFASCSGLSKFDGTTWSKIDTINGITGMNFYSISKDITGNLWFGTSNGLFKFNGIAWTRFTTANGLPTNICELVKCDNAGNVWVSYKYSGMGVSKFNGTTFTTYTTVDGLVHNNVLAIGQDISGNMWFGSAGYGLSKFNGSSWVTYNVYNTGSGLASDNISNIYTFNSDLYITTIFGNGMSRFNGTSWMTYNSSNGLVSNFTNCAYMDGSDLWIGTYDGLSIYNGNTYTNYTTNDGGLACNEITQIFIDHNKTIWIATNNGLSHYINGQFINYSINQGLSQKNIISLSEDNSGNIWAGTYYGLNKYSSTEWTAYHTGDGLPSEEIRMIMKDHLNNMWIATPNGVSKYDGSTFTNYSTTNGLASNDVKSIFEDKSNNIWFATSGGVSKYNGTTFTNYTTSNGLVGNDIRAICQDATGKMWFGTWGAGISRFDGVNWETINKSNYLKSNNISCLYRDSKDNIWIGNPYKYVTKYDGTTYQQIILANSNNNVTSICEDDSNHYWFGTWYGLTKLRYLNYNASLTPKQYPSGSIIPSRQVANGFSFGGKIKNEGFKNLTKLNLDVDVNNGYYFASEQLPYLHSGQETDIDIPGKLLTGNIKQFDVEYSLTSANVDEKPANNYFKSKILISDTVYARDNGKIIGEYTTSQGWSLGNIFDITKKDTLTSVSIYFSKTSTINPTGSKFSISVYQDFDGESQNTGDLIYETPIYEIDSTYIQKWITVDFKGTGVFLQPGRYLIALNAKYHSIVTGADTSSIAQWYGYYSLQSQYYPLIRANFGTNITKLEYPPALSLDINNIKALINSNGQMFNQNSAKFEVPKGSGVHSIFASNIWVAGIDDIDSLHLAAPMFNTRGGDYWPGPVAQNYDQNYDSRYKKVWKVSKSEIDNHKNNWSKTDYEIPSAISDWPAHGNTSNSEAFYLAPFTDVNENGIYEPELGDYPKIRGDQAIFLIYNDQRNAHMESKGEKLGIEIHCMAYAFNAPDDSMLNNTVFVNFNVKNRSGNSYHDVYTGIWSDLDIGNGGDDYIACDTLLNSYYGYNGTVDDGSGAGLYGLHPPAQGITFLSARMTSFVYYNNKGTGADATSDPNTPNQFYNYLTGKWKDGKPITFGGTGYNGVLPTKYVYPGNPVNSTGWSEVSAGNTPGDRRGMGVIGPFNLNGGEELCIDVAYPNARHYEGNYLNSVNLLKQRIKQLYNYYNSQSWVCNSSILLRLNINTQLAGCNQSNGSATASVTGGIPPYDYKWSSGDTTPIATNLTAGIYTLNVTDAVNNTVMSSIMINNISGPTINVDSINPISCFGRSDGAVFLSVSGIAPPFSYYWSNKAKTQNVKNLVAGPYYITVMDTLGCKTLEDINIPEPKPLNIILSSQNSECAKSTGSAFANPIGGTPPYSYLWSTSNTTNSISNVGFGSYSVTLKDGNQCSLTKKVTISEINGPVITTDSIVKAGCGLKNGAIYISTKAGTGYYEYLWSNNSDMEDITGLGAGEYQVVATDFNTCRAMATFEITTSKPSINPICIVTVDNEGKNLVVWDRQNENTIDHFNIYRESSQAGIYQFIGKNNYKEMTVFADTFSDPSVRSWRYKISVVDLCGQESDLSPLHKTIHLTANKGIGNEVNLIWDHYIGFSFNSYNIYRGITPSSMNYLTSIQNNLSSYTDKNPPNNLLFYQISAVKYDTCFPASLVRAQTNSGPYSQSVSNMKDYSINSAAYIDVYPHDQTIGIDSGSFVIFNVYTNLSSWEITAADPWLAVETDLSNKTIKATALSGSNSRSTTITIKAKGLPDIVVNVFQKLTSVKDQINEQTIWVYPNPFTNSTQLVYELKATTDVNVTVFDIYGKQLIDWKYPSQKPGKYHYDLSFDYSGQTKGVYILKYTANGKSILKRLVRM